MVDDSALKRWFVSEVLPLEGALAAFIRANWRSADEVADLRQEIYERALIGAQAGLPTHTRAYLYTIARNHLINRSKRARIVSIDLVSDLELLPLGGDGLGPERQLVARDELRRAQEGIERLPARCRQVVWLRKVEGLSTKEVAQRMRITVHTVEKQLTDGLRAVVDHMLGGSGDIRRFRSARRRKRLP